MDGAVNSFSALHVSGPAGTGAKCGRGLASDPISSGLIRSGKLVYLDPMVFDYVAPWCET